MGKEGTHWDSCFWSYNLPLQMWGRLDGTSRVLVYMPRKEKCVWLSHTVGVEERADFCEKAAQRFENLARQFRELACEEVDHVYYPDRGIASEVEDGSEK